MLIALLVDLGLLVFGGWAVASYNRLVRARIRSDEAWAQIDTRLQRRHDLIPNLVKTIKGDAAHERQTFEEVAAAGLDRSIWHCPVVLLAEVRSVNRVTLDITSRPPSRRIGRGPRRAA